MRALDAQALHLMYTLPVFVYVALAVLFVGALLARSIDKRSHRRLWGAR